MFVHGEATEGHKLHVKEWEQISWEDIRESRVHDGDITLILKTC